MATIMVIDDDASVRDILTRILEEAGHEVISIDDGIHAKKAIAEQNPDMIICDLLMPVLDGEALIYHLKYVEKLKTTPIMILTSLGEEKRYLGKELSADYYMAKPFDNEKLLGKVEELLNSVRVKVGTTANSHESMNENIKRKRSIAYVITALLAAIIVMAVYLLGSKHGINIEALGVIPDKEEVRSTSFLSDKLFIVAVPVAVGFLVYQTFLLKKMSVNQRKSRDKD